MCAAAIDAPVEKDTTLTHLRVGNHTYVLDDERSGVPASVARKLLQKLGQVPTQSDFATSTPLPAMPRLPPVPPVAMRPFRGLLPPRSTTVEWLSRDCSPSISSVGLWPGLSSSPIRRYHSLPSLDKKKRGCIPYDWRKFDRLRQLAEAEADRVIDEAQRQREAAEQDKLRRLEASRAGLAVAGERRNTITSFGGENAFVDRREELERSRANADAAEAVKRADDVAEAEDARNKADKGKGKGGKRGKGKQSKSKNGVQTTRNSGGGKASGRGGNLSAVGGGGSTSGSNGGSSYHDGAGGGAGGGGAKTGNNGGSRGQSGLGGDKTGAGGGYGGSGGSDEDEEDEGDGLAQVHVDWTSITKALPAGRDPESVERRKTMFAQWDVNGNKCLSFTEVDQAMRVLMGEVTAELLSTALYQWSNSWKPVIMRSFVRAKNSNKSRKAKSKRNDDYVEADEFRLLLLCMRQYFELYIAFSRLDCSSDRRLSHEEFINAVPVLQRWGVSLTEEEAKTEFQIIDDNGGGYILFDEFIVWALQKNLDLDDDDDFDDFDLEVDKL